MTKPAPKGKKREDFDSLCVDAMVWLRMARFSKDPECRALQLDVVEACIKRARKVS